MTFTEGRRRGVLRAATTAIAALAATMALHVATAAAVAPVVTANNGVLSWAPVPGATGYQVAVVRHPSTTRDTTYVNITATTYTPAAIPGETVNYGVYPWGASGATWSQEVAITWAVPANTQLPTISGSTKPGSTLTANKGTWTGYPTPTYTYQWLLCGTTCSPISGATSSTYATPLSYTNVGKMYAVTVTATSASGSLARTSAQTAAIPEPPAPVLSVSGKTISWTAVPGITQYKASIARTSGTTTTTVSGTSWTPPQVPAEHVSYSLAAVTPDNGAPSSAPVTLNWPIVGINAGAGWGPSAAAVFVNGHVTWDRVDLSHTSPTVADSVGDGFKVLGIVGNIADGTPLSTVTPSSYGASVVSQFQNNPGISIAEAGNEMYYKGGIADPVRYGQLYVAAANAMAAAGIHTKLLFNMWGDYYCPSTPGVTCPGNDWSQDAQGRGWLADAVDNVPGLAAAILANGLSSHPYGAVGANGADSYGTAALAAQEATAQSVLGTIPPFFITEYGFNLGACGDDTGACSQSDQATKLQQAMSVFLGDDHVEGVWWFQSLDYGSANQWGVLNDNYSARPAFTALSSIGQAQGQ